MKKLVLAALALTTSVVGTSAADLAARPYTKTSIIVDPVYNWTGFYAGLNAGYGWSSSSFNLTGDNIAGQKWIDGLIGNPNRSFDNSGFVGGGQIGYNWQINQRWVAGVETDINFADVRGRNSIPEVTGTFANTSFDTDRRLEWFGTLRGRLGVSPLDRLLIYATGGLAYGKVTSGANYVNGSGILLFGGVQPDGSGVICNVGTCIVGGGSRVAAGWTIGGGLEWAVANNWSVKAEYLYMNLGNQTIHSINTPPPGGLTAGSIATRFSDAEYNIVRVGMNYKFGGPVVAKY